jgi:ABC-2 type transport system permease protein
MMKDLRLLSRDRSALVFLLLVPMVVIFVIAETHSESGSHSIVFPIVNEDQGPVANALIKVFREHLDVRIMDRAGAEHLVKVENRAPAILVLPPGMSKRYLTEKESTIELLTDPAQWTELQAIKVIMLLADREAASLGDPFHEELLKIDERSLTGERLSFTSLEQNIPGLAITFVLINMIFSVCFGMRDEEIWGTSTRLGIAPISPVAVIGGKLLARFVIGTLQLLILLLFGGLLYDLSLGKSPLALVLVAASIVFSMSAFSVIIAAIARTREQIIPVGMSAMFALTTIGGCWWPFYESPKWMQTIAQGLMTTWSMFALHDVMLRGRTVIEAGPKILFLFAYGAVSFMIGLRLFRYTER